MADITLNVKADTSDAEKSLDQFADKAKKSSDSIGASFGALKGVIGAAVAFLAAGEIIGFLSDGVDAASAQQDALRNLEQQLLLTGDASEAALEQFADFAGQIEATTGIADDMVIQNLALAKSFGVSNEQAQKMVAAATELSAVTGKSLDASVRTLGKSLSGTLGPLDDSVDAIKGLTAAELENGKAIDVILDRYGGSAAAKLDTFSGSVTKASNAFGDLGEAFGEVIVNNPVIQAVFAEITSVIRDLEAFVKDNQDTMRGWITNGILASAVALEGLIDILQFVGLGLAGLGVIVETFEEIWDATIGNVIRGGLELLEFVGLLDEGARDSFDGFTESVKDGTKAFTDGVLEMTAKGDDLKTGIENATARILDAESRQRLSQRETQKVRSDASARGVQDAKDLAKAAQEGEKITAEVRKTNESAIDAEIRKREELLARIKQNVADRGLSEEQAAALRIDLEQKTNDKIAELNQKAVAEGIELAKKAAEEQRQAIATAASNPIEFILKGGDLNASSAAAIGVGITSNILDGAEGARKLLATGAGAIADTFLPGIGGAVSTLVEQLSRGPEENKKMVKAFVEALPDLIEAIADSIPVIVEALVDSLINEGGLVRIAIALAKALAGEAIWKAIGAQIGLEFGRAFNLDQIGTTISNGFTQGVNMLAQTITNLPQAFFAGGQQVAASIKNAISEALVPLTEGFRQAGDIIVDILGAPIAALRGLTEPIRAAFTPFSAAVSFLSRTIGRLQQTPQWLNVLFGAFESFAEFLNDIFSFNVGGNGGFLGTGLATGIKEVPPGFPNDTFPARLTSGERVVPAGTNADLTDFLDAQGNDNGKLDVVISLLGQIASGMANGGGGLAEVTLKIDGRTLAQELTNIDRRNLRTRA